MSMIRLLEPRVPTAESRRPSPRVRTGKTVERPARSDGTGLGRHGPNILRRLSHLRRPLTAG